MKKLLIPLLLVSTLVTTSCNTDTSTNINTNKDVIIKSPNEDGGLEGNAENDTVKEQSSTELKDFLLKVADVEYFTYEVTSKVSGNESHFIDYFTPNAWYEENDNPDLSFGYAQEKGSKAIFKYYLSIDEKTAIPSIYEYTGMNNEISKLQDLYGTWTIAHINLLKESMDDFSATSQGLNKFILTDSNTASIFQYMTTFGTSITNYIVATYIDIIDEEELIFKSTIDLGAYGSIESIFTPTYNTKINFVNDLVKNGKLKGVDYHQDVYDFLNKKIMTNNYVLRGVKQKIGGKESQVIPYTIHCTNNYFYLEYEDPNYDNWGYALVPANTPVTYYETQADGTVLEKTQTLAYTACYGFTQLKDGSFMFDYFKGPIESDLKYIEVDKLPATGEEYTLYIVYEDGNKKAYYYTEVTSGVYDWAEYSYWYNSVGNFYINDYMATFYLSGSALSSIGALYFEKDLKNENTYYSTNPTVLGALAHGLFGWGFQATNTWMEFVRNSKIRINKDSSNEITSYDVGLDVEYFSNGVSQGLGEIYYTIEDFGNGNVSEIESFLNDSLGGAYNE